MEQEHPVGRRDSAEMLTAIRRLRFRVYCLEREYVDVRACPHGQELDEYDAYAVHLAAVDPAGEVVGTLRLISGSPLGLPLERHLEPSTVRAVDQPRVGEVSRFIVERRYCSVTPGGRDVLAVLFSALYQESERLGLTGLIAAMEPALARLLRWFGLHFAPLGPAIEYLGQVVPYYAPLTSLVAPARLLRARAAAGRLELRRIPSGTPLSAR
jgi:N-acyl-L-homoserine lactone synthetase